MTRQRSLRRYRLLALAALFTLSAAGCPSKENSPADDLQSAEAMEEAMADAMDEAAAPKLTTVDDLNIRLDASGVDALRQVQPSVGLVFKRRIDGSATALSKDTDVTIEPKVPGKWTRRNRAINFSPEEGFKPSTTYRILLSAVSTGNVVLTTKDKKPREFSFTTPAFSLKRVEFLGANKSKSQADLKLVFSGPVSLGDVSRFGAAKANGQEVSNIKYEPEGNYKVKVRLRHPQIVPGNPLTLVMGAGLTSALDRETSTEESTHQWTIPQQKPIQIAHTYLRESEGARYIQINCRDHSFKKTRWYYDHEIRSGFRASERCMFGPESAAAGISFDPPTKFTLAKNGGGFRIFGDFKQGPLVMTIKAGVTSLDGGALNADHTHTFEVPPITPKIRFTTQGRYLPRKTWKDLAFRHINVKEIEVNVRHVPQENLVFWLSSNNEKADARTSNVIYRETLNVPLVDDVWQTTPLDLTKIKQIPPKGLMEIKVTQKGKGSVNDTRRFIATDLNLVAKRARSGNLSTWVLDMQRNEPVSAAQVRLLKPSGALVSECQTNSSGYCELAPLAKDALDQTRPVALVAQKGADLTYLKFADLELNAADADVHGISYEGGKAYSGFIYSDRGVYRPGETAHVAALFRTKTHVAPKQGMPVTLKLFDPKRKVVRKRVLKLDVNGLVTADFKFAAFANTGRYQLQAFVADKQIADYYFNIEEFVPERMKVTVTPVRNHALVTDELSVNVGAKYLFGGSADGSPVEASCEIRPGQFKPEKNKDFNYGVWFPAYDQPKPLVLGKTESVLDKSGKTTVACPSLKGVIQFAGTGQATVNAAVFEAGSGRTTQNKTSWSVHPENYYLGLKTGVEKVEEGKAFEVTGAVVDWDGNVVADVQEVKYELLSLQNRWERTRDDETGETRWMRHLRASVAHQGKIKVNNGRFKTKLTPDQNAAAYLVRVKSGQAQTDVKVEGADNRYYWRPDESSRDQTPRPLQPTSLKIKTPETIGVREEVTVTVTAPFSGDVLWALETDRVLESQITKVTAGENSWSFEVPQFYANVYVSAFLLKDPHLESARSFLPDRAYGVQSIRMRPQQFTQDLKITVPKEVRSNSPLEVKIQIPKSGKPSIATVAVVDEGILSLTRFKTPDPFPAIFKKHRLEVATFETIGWNMLQQSTDTSLSTGGGEEAKAQGRVQPVKPVALWSGPVPIGEDGKATVSFDVPQYRGALRVMVVTASATQMGQGEAEVLVRDPLVLQTTLPRFLIRGDKAEVPVFVTNLSGKKQKVTVKMKSKQLPVPGLEMKAWKKDLAPVTVKGTGSKSITLQNGENGTVVFELTAEQLLGAASLWVEASAGQLISKEKLDVPFGIAKPKSRTVQRIELAEGNTDLKPLIGEWLPTTEKTEVWVTSNPYADVFDHLTHLIRYPYGCIEQTTSSTRPLLAMGNYIRSNPTLSKGKDVEAMVMHGINRVLSMQTPSGGFGYWPGDHTPTHWGTAYATHMLMDAQKLGYPVEQERIDDALEFMGNELTNRYGNLNRSSSSYRYYRDAEPYFHYLIALHGQGRKGRLQNLVTELQGRKLKSQEKEYLYMMQAALYLAGDRRYEGDLKNPDVSTVEKKRRNSWSFYSDRRRRGFMLNIFADLFKSDKAGQRLADLVANNLRGNRSTWYTTQELVWGTTGLAKYVNAGADQFQAPDLLADGKKFKPSNLTKTAERIWHVARASEYKTLSLDLNDKGDSTVYLVLSSEGIKKEAVYEFGGKGLALKRTFHDATGKQLDLTDGSVAFGKVVYIQVEITNTTGDSIQNIALVDRIPSGWEIENPRLGRSQATSWYNDRKKWSTDYMNIRDDRIELFGKLEAQQRRTFLYAVRSVTSGQFVMPPVEAEAMYDPEIWAREPGKNVVIPGPWEEFLN